jgi:hypothetical protein
METRANAKGGFSMSQMIGSLGELAGEQVEIVDTA